MRRDTTFLPGRRREVPRCETAVGGPDRAQHRARSDSHSKLRRRLTELWTRPVVDLNVAGMRRWFSPPPPRPTRFNDSRTGCRAFGSVLRPAEKSWNRSARPFLRPTLREIFLACANV